MTDQQKHLIERIRSGHIQLHRQIVQLITDLDARLAAAEAWRGMIDPFVRRIMDELGCGKACGGLDADQNDPNSTTQVVLQGIRDGQQRTVDAALEHVAGLFDRVGKRDEAAFLRSWRGTNPLAEAQRRIAELERELETERMRLAACGVVAMSNTQESAKSAREMKDEYWSTSCADVAAAVDREMELRAELEDYKRLHFMDAAMKNEQEENEQ